MLNIIGGLDQYTSGDLKINGRSTKKFKDRDWDAYRNNSIGFVFQSYNLIPHQTVWCYFLYNCNDPYSSFTGC